MRDLLHDRDVEPFEQRHALGETLAEVDLAPHRAFGDGAHLRADACPFGQFVDHFGFDECRIHVETDQPPAAAEDVVALERDVHPVVREGHELLLNGRRGLFGERSAHREFDA